LQDPPKFTRIGISGLKINHLATLEGVGSDAENVSVPFSCPFDGNFFTRSGIGIKPHMTDREIQSEFWIAGSNVMATTLGEFDHFSPQNIGD
jgi:hypothetical protein